MEALGLLLHGFAVLLTWKTLVLMMVGLVLGIFVGVLPGLGGPNGVAILLPLTFTMDPTSAIVMLSCIYWGALFGGAITSILFNIPGEAWSVATTFDGYPMAQQGRAAEALTAAFTSSFIGSLVAVLLITFLAPMISSFALKFGPPEFFAVYLLTFCSFVGLGREAKHKTVISMSLGLLLAGIGMDTVSGNLRMTFGSAELLRGINFLVAVIGLFGISEILLTMEERLALRGHAASISLRVVLGVWKDLPKYWVTLLRSSFIGCWLGITPGGAIAASFMGYNLAKRFSKDPESFGKGRIEGVFAPETAAHASGTAALLPMLALGIPGSGTAAILLGGLMVWGLNPGPLLFVEHKDFVWGLIASMYLGNVVGLVLVLTTVPIFASILRVPLCGGGADDRGILRDRRLCDPERDVRHLADAGLRRRWLRLQEDRNSAGAVYARPRPRQPCRGRIPPVDDRLRRRPQSVLGERAGRVDYHAGDSASVLAADRWPAGPLRMDATGENRITVNSLLNYK
ncbi:putative tricarboxylic transport membrane protein [Bradyrhizobium diazoefficiens]